MLPLTSTCLFKNGNKVILPFTQTKTCPVIITNKLYSQVISVLPSVNQIKHSQAEEGNETNIDVSNWVNAIPYSDVPGPKPIPVLGNSWRFIPYIG